MYHFILNLNKIKAKHFIDKTYFGFSSLPSICYPKLQYTVQPIELTFDVMTSKLINYLKKMMMFSLCVSVTSFFLQ